MASTFASSCPVASSFGGYAGYTKPYTYGPYEKFTGYPTGGFPTSTFTAPTTTSAYPWTAGFGGVPTEFARFGGYPWTTGGFPSTWAAGYGAGYPSTWTGYGGYPTSWTGYGGYPTEWSRFGAAPWASTWGAAPWSSTWGAGKEMTTGAFPWANRWANTFATEAEKAFSTFDKELGFLKNLFAWDNKTGPISPKDYSSSFVQLPGRPSSSIEYWTFMNPIRFDGEGRRWIRYCFDLPSFKPEEVKVTFYAKATPAPYFEIIAVHDVKSTTAATKEHEVKRVYERKVFLPADLGLKAEELAKLEFKSHFANDGILYVEAVLPYCAVAASKAGFTSGYPSWSANIEVTKKDM